MPGISPNRHENRDDCEGRCDDGQADFVSSIDRGIIDTLSRLPYVSNDVLNFHNGVVDQDSDNDSNRQKRDIVKKID